MNYVVEEQLEKVKKFLIFLTCLIYLQIEEQREKFNHESVELTNKIEIYEHELQKLNNSIQTLKESHKSDMLKKDKEKESILQVIKIKDEEIEKLKLEIKKIYKIKSNEQMYYQSVLINLRDDSLKQKFVEIISSLNLFQLLDNLSSFYDLFSSRNEGNVQNLNVSLQNLKDSYNTFIINLSTQSFHNFEVDFRQLRVCLRTFFQCLADLSQVR